MTLHELRQDHQQRCDQRGALCAEASLATIAFTTSGMLAAMRCGIFRSIVLHDLRMHHRACLEHVISRGGSAAWQCSYNCTISHARAGATLSALPYSQVSRKNTEDNCRAMSN